MAPRGWGQREQMAAGDQYQAVCGHYIKRGVYQCRDCNIAPLEELLEARELIIVLEAELAKRRVAPG